MENALWSLALDESAGLLPVGHRKSVVLSETKSELVDLAEMMHVRHCRNQTEVSSLAIREVAALQVELAGGCETSGRQSRWGVQMGVVMDLEGAKLGGKDSYVNRDGDAAASKWRNPRTLVGDIGKALAACVERAVTDAGLMTRETRPFHVLRRPSGSGEGRALVGVHCHAGSVRGLLHTIDANAHNHHLSATALNRGPCRLP